MAARQLQDLGIGPGDVVALQLTNRVAFVVLLFAAWRLGATITPVHPSMTDVEVVRQLQDSGARLLVVEDGMDHRDQLEPAGATPLTADPALALALIAQDVIDLLLSAEIRRVRVCGADRCALRFLDRSPAHNRRWCSMARCGNRAKVRLHQARTRQSGRTAES
jgi:predicted RNA-binding Zn ribbon-like protein